LGDIDLAIDIGLRDKNMNPVEENRKMVEYLRINRSPRNIIEQLWMTDIYIKRVLKDRKPTISLHDIDEPEKIGTESVTVYEYQPETDQR